MALVVMIRGVYSNWKQPLSFYFVADSCPAEKIQQIIFERIIQLRNIDLNVQAVISDMGSNFVQVVKKLNVTSEQKVHYIFDIPHLLKAIRNNLITYRFVFGHNQASWNDIETIYLNDINQDFHLIPKLTIKHIQ